MADNFSVNLRWVLLGIGIVCIAAIYFYTVWNNRRQRDDPYESRQEPELAKQQSGTTELKQQHLTQETDHPTQADLVEAQSNEINEHSDAFSLPQDIEIGQADEQVIHSEQLEGIDQEEISSSSDSSAESESAPAVDEPQEIIILYVEQHKDGKHIAGSDLMRFASSRNLVRAGLADQGFFTSTTGSFYLTNLLEPGTFNWDEMHRSQLKGVSFFFSLPLDKSHGEKSATDILDEMSACAVQLAEQLDAQVYDDQHVMLSEEKYQMMKNRVREIG